METLRPRGALENRIFRKVTNAPVGHTAANENVGADLRAATNSTQATAATERGGHLQDRIFMKERRTTQQEAALIRPCLLSSRSISTTSLFFSFPEFSGQPGV